MRRVLAVTLKVAAVTLLSLVAAEGALRVAAHFMTEPALRVAVGRGLPSSAVIAAYGDSTPFGLGNTTSFPTEIGRLAGVEVVNRSRPGVNSTQVSRILREDLSVLRPHVILVMAGVNDGWNLESTPARHLGPKARWRSYLPEWRMLRMLSIWWETGGYEYDRAQVTGWKERDETARLLGNDALREILSESYSTMASLASEHGAEILFVGYQAHGWNHVADVAEDVLRKEHPDRYVPVRDLFTGRGSTLLQKDVFHPTDEGQRLIAARVLAWLRERGWIDPAIRAKVAPVDPTRGP